MANLGEDHDEDSEKQPRRHRELSSVFGESRKKIYMTLFLLFNKQTKYQIKLLNVEGKLFFSLKSERSTNFLLENKLINTYFQKEEVPEVSGYLENSAILSQLIREAKHEKKSLVVTWIYISNAYGSKR